MLKKKKALLFLIISFSFFSCSVLNNKKSDRSDSPDRNKRSSASITDHREKRDNQGKITEYHVVDFERGSFALTSESRQSLKKIRNSQGEKLEIDEIKVLAWADQDFPMTGEVRADGAAIKLADNRADVIKSFLTDDLNLSTDVDLHNMARRPGFLSELMQTDDFKIKNNFKTRSPAAADLPASIPQLTGSKVSKALILVEYE